jgi:hypothetical protein
MSGTHWLSENFTQTFGFPEDAKAWLLSLWNAIQVFDDMADGEAPDRDDLDAALYDVLVAMPSNDFFLRHAHILLPVVATQILKWKGSDTAERAGEADARSFGWRAGYYDVVLIVAQLVHGQEAAMHIAHRIMALYGEDFAAYCDEFDEVADA